MGGDQDSAVGIMTCYGLPYLGIESRWGRKVLCHQDPHRGNGPKTFLRDKRPFSGAVHSTL